MPCLLRNDDAHQLSGGAIVIVSSVAVTNKHRRATDGCRRRHFREDGASHRQSPGLRFSPRGTLPGRYDTRYDSGLTVIITGQEETTTTSDPSTATLLHIRLRRQNSASTDSSRAGEEITWGPGTQLVEFEVWQSSGARVYTACVTRVERYQSLVAKSLWGRDSEFKSNSFLQFLLFLLPVAVLFQCRLLPTLL